MAKVSRPRVVGKQRFADVRMPAQVTLSLAELARSAKEHLLSLSVAASLLVLRELLEAEVTRLVGPRGEHQARRRAYRHGWEVRFVTLGGRLVEVERPRARSRAGRELRLPTYEAVADRGPLSEAALARMLAGLSTRHYPAGLEPVGDELRTRGTGRPAVSRRFVQATAAKLAQLLSRDLSKLGLLAVFIDGIQIGGHSVVVALGVDAEGHKAHPGPVGGHDRERRGLPGAALGPHRPRAPHRPGPPSDHSLGDPLLDGMRQWPLALKDAFPDELRNARIDRGEYLVRQLWWLVRGWRDHSLGRAEALESARSLTRADLAHIGLALARPATLGRAVRAASRMESRARWVWPDARPLDGICDMREFIAWLRSASCS